MVRFPESESPSMTIERTTFGRTPGGDSVACFSLENGRGTRIELIELGAAVRSVQLLDGSGSRTDIVLGYDDLEGYLSNPAYLGCIAGRVANRIAGGRFVLDGKAYALERNDGPHHLHGGSEGLHGRLWRGEPRSQRSVRFAYRSPDGEGGYPGTLELGVTYVLSEDDELRIEYEAETDTATPVNLTNHSYFNLNGHSGPDVANHVLELRASRYTVPDATRIPTGELRAVNGSAFDFTRPAALRERLEQLPGDPAGGDPGGLDHNYVLDSDGGGVELAARVAEPGTRRTLEVLTSEPGVQVYTGNFLDGSIVGKAGARYGKHQGLCLETQHFPDSVNRPEFPSVVLRPGRTWTSTTVYRFGRE
jgi:aldose 1-epimerase